MRYITQSKASGQRRRNPHQKHAPSTLVGIGGINMLQFILVTKYQEQGQCNIFEDLRILFLIKTLAYYLKPRKLELRFFEILSKLNS